MNIMTEYDDMSVFKKPYGHEYRLEITHWVRSFDGDDLIDSEYWLNFDSLQEAKDRIIRLDKKSKNLIEIRLYRMVESMELIYSKDYIDSKINDKTWKYVL
jgi:hypothetical protein